MTRFETIRVRDGIPVRLVFHLARLYDCGLSLSVSLPPELDEIETRCIRLPHELAIPEGRMRIELEDGPGSAPPRIELTPFAGYPRELFERGAVARLAGPRGHPLGARAGVKALPYDVMDAARAEATAAGALETVFVDEDGALLEGAYTNLFARVDGEVRTPPLTRPLLPGITRRWAIFRLSEAGFPVAERDVTLADLDRVEEAFLTSSLMGAMPLRRLGPRALAPGPAARALADL